MTVLDGSHEGEGQREFIRLRPVVNQIWRKQTPGFIAISDLRTSRSPAGGRDLVQLIGADEETTSRT